MARGSNTAKAAANSAAGLSQELEGKANAGFNFAMPELEAEAANPQGFGPTTMAKMETAAQQGAGGTQAAAEGKGALLASRTRNPGTAAAAIGEAARGAGEDLSKERLGTEIENEKLKQSQRQAGLTGVENLTGLNTNAGIASAGQIAPDVNANTNAANQSWDWTKFVLDPLLSAGGAVGAAKLGAAG